MNQGNSSLNYAYFTEIETKKENSKDKVSYKQWLVKVGSKDMKWEEGNHQEKCFTSQDQQNLVVVELKFFAKVAFREISFCHLSMSQGSARYGCTRCVFVRLSAARPLLLFGLWGEKTLWKYGLGFAILTK